MSRGRSLILMNDSLPKTGDLVEARYRMRAWENDHERGTEGIWTEVGDLGMVLAVWGVGRGRIRMKLLINDRIAMFSCHKLDLPRNWPIVNRQSPTSGSL